MSRRAGLTAGRKPDLSDPGSFESAVEDAFGPGYDPTDFRRWAIRSRLPICWASGTEPFQDATAARAILSIAGRLALPLYLQLKGRGWREAWDAVTPLAGNVALGVSFPTEDDRVLKRFEPGTPNAAERHALIDAALDLGIPVDVSFSPFHPDWCGDLPGFARRLIARGINQVFLDPLRLDHRQAAVCTDPATVALAKSAWSDRFIEVASAVREECVSGGAGFWMADWRAPVHGLDDLPDRVGWPYRSARRWPYVDRAFLNELTALCPTPGPPVLVPFAAALAAMEGQGGATSQPFTWSGLGHDQVALRRVPAAWTARLKPAAPIAEYFRALWNTPRNHGFAWRHPFVRVAMRPGSKEAWVDSRGDVLMAFDPYWPGKNIRREIEDPSACRWYGAAEYRGAA